MKLKIDADFKNLIPALSPVEFKQLEENIVSEKRCREAILLWKGFIVDGHNRYEICQNHKIYFEVKKLHFAVKEDVLIWIAEHQLGRRNLSDAVRIDIASRMAEMLQKKAKENSQKPINIRKSVAAATGLSEQTVHRYMKLVGCADAEVVERLRNGEGRINTAYNEMMAVSREVRLIDVGGGERMDEEVKVYCELGKRVERLFRVCRVLGLARRHGGIEVVGVRGLVERWLEVFEGR